MVEVPKPFDEDIGGEAVKRWLNQCNTDERSIIEKLLPDFRHYSSRKVNSSVRLLHSKSTRYSIAFSREGLVCMC